jgi:hypothetical protein
MFTVAFQAGTITLELIVLPAIRKFRGNRVEMSVLPTIRKLRNKELYLYPLSHNEPGANRPLTPLAAPDAI